jgi:predicted  nucleic acid-binding Zn-ribbon protein
MPSRKPTAEAPPETGAPRDPLTILVLLQDLDLLLREASDPKQAEEAARMGFKSEGLEELRAGRELLAASLEPRVLRQYEAASKRYAGRALVPLKNRTCLGCSGLLPTGAPMDPHRILTCQSCGRILYPL